jgi:hypothetical protein
MMPVEMHKQAHGMDAPSAINVVLQKELTYDIAACTLHNLAMMENDATACFDQMIPSLVMLSLRAYRVPKAVITLMGKTLENALHNQDQDGHI